MTTQAEFLTNLRIRLNDDAATRWSDEELTLYLQESVLRYSKLFPKLKETEFTMDGETSRFDIPADLVDRKIHNLWEVTQNRLVEIIPDILRSRWQVRFFDVIDDSVILGYVPSVGAVLRMRYSCLHVLPSIGNSTVPSEDEDLIYLWAEHLAWRKIGGSDASLSRWREEGKRNDGPIIPHYMWLDRKYQQLVEEKKAGGRFLQRTRAQRRRQRWGGVLY